MEQISDFFDDTLENLDSKPLGIGLLYKESKDAFDEKAELWLDIYGKDELFIPGKAEELELCADISVVGNQTVFKIGYCNRKKKRDKILIDVPFNISLMELAKILEAGEISDIVIFVVTILHAIAVITGNPELEHKTGNATFSECGKIMCLYEEKIREYLEK